MKKILEKRDAEVGAEEISAPMNDTENRKQAIIKTKKNLWQLLEDSVNTKSVQK